MRWNDDEGFQWSGVPSHLRDILCTYMECDISTATYNWSRYGRIQQNQMMRHAVDDYHRVRRMSPTLTVPTTKKGLTALDMMVVDDGTDTD